MTKNIILIRHAKSDWDNPLLSDHQRILNNRGKRDLPIMASVLIQSYPKIDYALSSDSARTQETINSLKKYGYELPEIHFTKNLYLANIEQFESEISALHNSINSIVVCAHNPGISEFTMKLCKLDFLDMPTLATAWIETEIDSWQEIYTARGILKKYDYPKKK